MLSSFLPAGKDSWQGESSVREAELYTVDDFCIAHSVQRIDILKSDTQGYDLNVFKGASWMMREGRIGLVFTEINFDNIYEGQGSAGQVFDYLTGQGFRLFSIYQIFRRDGWAAWTDALFVHRSLAARPQ